MTTEGDVGISVIATFPSGAQQSFLVDSARALVGSAPHCEIRIAGDWVAREHIRLSVEGGLVCAVPAAGVGQMLRSGLLFPGGPLAAGERLDIGNGVVVQVAIVALGSSGRRRFPLEYLAVIPAAAAVLLTLLVATPDIPVSLPVAPAATALFDESPPACTVSDAEQAIQLARRQEAIAVAQNERAPFEAGDGVSAVLSFRMAASCYQIGGDGASRRRVEEAGKLLSVRIDEEFLMRRTRLEHATDVVDFEAVRRELPHVRALVSHRSGAYVDWLTLVDRAQKKEKESSSALF